jgi:hypothetical protein
MDQTRSNPKIEEVIDDAELIQMELIAGVRRLNPADIRSI